LANFILGTSRPVSFCSFGRLDDNRVSDMGATNQNAAL
jgi:hypothetical protein